MDLSIFKIQDEYTLMKDPEEILYFLHYLNKCNITLLAWQKNIRSKRVVIPSFLQRIQTQTNYMQMIPTQSDLSYDSFYDTREVYLHSKYRSFLAQVKIRERTDRVLTLEAPTSIKIKDLRNEPRKRFMSDTNFVAFTKQRLFYEYPLVDISSTGMAVLVPQGPSSYFSYQDDEIQIEKLIHHKLGASVKANIVYIRPSEEKNRFRVGFQFQEKIPYEEIITPPKFDPRA